MYYLLNINQHSRIRSESLATENMDYLNCCIATTEYSQSQIKRISLCLELIGELLDCQEQLMTFGIFV